MGKKKKVHHEEHADEGWLLPYSDMLTLLVALFIVMFAMSQVDKAKAQKLSEQFNIIFSGGKGALQNQGGTPSTMDQISTTSGAAEQSAMNTLKDSLEKEMTKNGYDVQIKTDSTKDGLEISIGDAVLFSSGDATVSPSGNVLLGKIAGMIKNYDNEIVVEGFTDNLPISNSNFRSNWDLSAIRAINVMNYMVYFGGLNSKKVSIRAYGENNPKYDNSTPEGRAKNRRVVILLARKYPAPAELTPK
ncbi:MAG: OmpA family protein [Solirubrobacterales bacterium]